MRAREMKIFQPLYKKELGLEHDSSLQNFLDLDLLLEEGRSFDIVPRSFAAIELSPSCAWASVSHARIYQVWARGTAPVRTGEFEHFLSPSPDYVELSQSGLSPDYDEFSESGLRSSSLEGVELLFPPSPDCSEFSQSGLRLQDLQKAYAEFMFKCSGQAIQPRNLSGTVPELPSILRRSKEENFIRYRKKEAALNKRIPDKLFRKLHESTPGVALTERTPMSLENSHPTPFGASKECLDSSNLNKVEECIPRPELKTTGATSEGFSLQPLKYTYQRKPKRETLKSL
ncbi:hypothetical protein AgCh_011464 [Apium graveolens]